MPVTGQTFYADYVQSYPYARCSLSWTLSRDNLQNDTFECPSLVTFPSQHLLLRLVNQGERVKPKLGGAMLTPLRGLPQGVGADGLAAFFSRQIGLARAGDFR